MIREIAAAVGGVVSALAAFLFVLFYPGIANPTETNTGFYRQFPITGPFYGPTNQTPNLIEVSGIYSGVLPALLLVLLAVGSGIVVSKLGRSRLEGDEAS